MLGLVVGRHGQSSELRQPRPSPSGPRPLAPSMGVVRPGDLAPPSVSAPGAPYCQHRRLPYHARDTARHPRRRRLKLPAPPPPAGIRARHGGVVAVPAGPALQRPPASLASASAAVADIPARGRTPRRVPPVCLDRPRAWGARQLRLRRRPASPASQALPALATRATPADIGLTTACHARL